MATRGQGSSSPPGEGLSHCGLLSAGRPCAQVPGVPLISVTSTGHLLYLLHYGICKLRVMMPALTGDS